MVLNLKLFDELLLTFDYDNTTLNGEICKIIYVNEENKELLPIGMEINEKGIISWLKTRTIPKNREYVETFLSKLGLSSNDISVDSYDEDIHSANWQLLREVLK